ncbi:DNA ligase D [Roseivivax isoporae]|uniref:DNA ligase (ATP) n=1 Tax=Roseivivax isoporae LMG 25204 TaxID=1449351 RepID=X7F6L4_9RHOB|nr:DNA ligase D [Roseivivax isoporae]ETX27741.1 ATP-dependent DNA ligase [Roseivivax isoporae LMG 25204]
MNPLDAYRGKRDFSVTPEPVAEIVDAGANRPLFVVQKHDAQRLHYDFRLEWGGVLWSWAVTKGPSTDPREKRLAVRTEDHPVAYGDFEGTIPEAEYGGGTVMLWDQGHWEPLHDPETGLAEGKLHFRLHGARMDGGWALVRMRGRKGEARENWLLVKEKDDRAGRSADALLNRHRRSVTTGRTMREIAAGTEGPRPPAHGGARPRFRKVQLATLEEAPPEGTGWQHEAKFDGYRMLLAIGKGGVRFHSRNGKDWTDRVAALTGPADALAVDAALIDGEVIAGGGGGDFSALQAALRDGGALTFYAFDCLHLDGEDMTARPLSDRREALERALSGVPPRGAIRLSPVLAGDGADALAAVCAAGGEGLVSKRADAPYRGGRSRAWIKSKCVRRAEFVVAGWSDSDRPGRPFASLLVGSHENGTFVYRGRVGSGFSQDDLEALSAVLASSERKGAPFDGPLPAETRGARWVTPQHVIEVAYAEFTAEGRIRHGVFKGLREDKEAADVSAGREAHQDKGGGDTVGGIAISHPDRVVYPTANVTKGAVARHYDRVAEALLRHAAQRPVSLLRCPGGIGDDCFFQKHAGKGFPAALRTVPIEEKDGGTEDYMYLSGPDSVLAAVQMGTLEFHVWGARRDRLDRPDRMVFDLDPDEGLGFDAVRDAARDLRDHLARIGLPCGAMVTGGKGVHVVVPLKRQATWDTVKGFAKTFAHILAERAPERYTATMSKQKRRGRIFVDWLRNERGATAIAPYALRAREGAPVAVPVTWDELSRLDRANGFTIGDMADRLGRDDPLAEAAERPTAITRAVVDALEDWAKDA